MPYPGNIFPDYLYYSIYACLSALILSVIGLYNRFGPRLRTAILTWAGVGYLFLSIIGATLVTLIMDASGIKMIDDKNLNYILLGLIGAGIFLGILSKIAVDGQGEGKLQEIKTLSDYIYEALNDSMTRKVDQETQYELDKLLEDYEMTDFLTPVPGAKDGRGIIIQLIDTSSYLAEEKKQELKVHIEEMASLGNYAAIFFELTKSETNITMKRLRNYIEHSGLSKKKTVN